MSAPSQHFVHPRIVYGLMQLEENRFRSFTGDENNFQVNTNDLARAGFFYTGVNDLVMCPFCHARMYDWKKEDIPLKEHKKRFPGCSFFNDYQGISHTSDREPKVKRGCIEPKVTYKDVKPDQKIVDRLMKLESNRVQSFNGAQQNFPNAVEEIARAGFYYMGSQDYVKCAYCSGGLYNWEPWDVPLLEHKEKYPFCYFVQQQTAAINCDVSSSISKFTKPNELEPVWKFPQYATAQARLSTFQYWSIFNHHCPDILVDAGFFHTPNQSHQDCLTCFSCGISQWAWRETDSPWEEHAKYGPQCPYLVQKKTLSYVNKVQKECFDNLVKRLVDSCMNHDPLSSSVLDSRYEDETARLATYEKAWMSRIFSHKPAELAEAGFIHSPKTRIESRVVCFACELEIITDNEVDDPWTLHAKYRPTCIYLSQNKPMEFVVRVQRILSEKLVTLLSEVKDQTSAELLRTLNNVPSKNWLINLNTRLNTYNTWPSYVPQRPEHLAKAGFYYDSTQDITDRVCCFHCGLGLHNWQAMDDPWVEHARHRPLCSYLLQQKSMEFVIKVYEKDVKPVFATFPNYRKRENRLKSFENWPQNTSQHPIDLSASGFFYENREDEVCCFSCGLKLKSWKSKGDPWEEHAKHSMMCPYLRSQKGSEFVERAHKITTTTQENAIGKVIDMGFDKDLVCKVLQISGKEFSNPEDLVHELLREQERVIEPSAPPMSSDIENEPSAPPISSDMENTPICHICMDADTNTAFQPCGHAVSCRTCAPNLSHCPICRRDIVGIVNIYIA